MYKTNSGQNGYEYGGFDQTYYDESLRCASTTRWDGTSSSGAAFDFLDLPVLHPLGGSVAVENATRLSSGRVPGDSDTSLYMQYEATRLLSDAWYKFKVQAVDAYGNANRAPGCTLTSSAAACATAQDPVRVMRSVSVAPIPQLVAGVVAQDIAITLDHPLDAAQDLTITPVSFHRADAAERMCFKYL